MIRYALACAKGHDFDSWFRNSAAYEHQLARGLLACPICGGDKVEKALMTPRLARSEPGAKPVEAETTESAPAAVPASPPVESQGVAIMSPQEREFRAKLKALRDHLTQNSDYVGKKFPEEARRMHYGETEHRSIYGEASPDEASALHDEGIAFHPLPVIPDERN